MTSLGFKKFKYIHMIGIGGSGMIGVATILQKIGFEVTGSDLVITDEVNDLIRLGAKVQLGHKLWFTLKTQIVLFMVKMLVTLMEVLTLQYLDPI